MKQKALGIIPARGGSKGIPRKNIKSIFGKPLMAWTIEAAQESKLLDRFVVSTEDSEIKKIALDYGAEVIDRPQEFATDTASTWSVLNHVLRALMSDYTPDAVVALQVTLPYRSPGLIDRCIRKFFDGNYDSVVTGFIWKDEPYGLQPRRRQDIEGVLYADGSIYVIKSHLILNGDTIGKNYSYVPTTKEEQVDIDEPFDFWLAEKVLEEKA